MKVNFGTYREQILIFSMIAKHQQTVTSSDKFGHYNLSSGLSEQNYVSQCGLKK